MIAWKSTAEIEPPKDRLILITSGIAWRREDTTRPARTTNRGVVIPERHYKSRRAIGGVQLVYWLSPEEAGQKEGVWVEFGRNWIGQQTFEYWAEFNNPITESLPGSYHGTDVPDVDQLEVYVPSPEEIRGREMRAALGL